MGVQVDLFKGLLSHKHKWVDLKPPHIINHDLTVVGTFTVQGSLVQEQGIIVQGVLIEDNMIVLNNGETGAGVTLGTAGFEIDRGALDNVYILYNETDDLWHYGIVGGADYIIANTNIINLLTFSNGLTRTLNNVVNNLITGLLGGQTISGGTQASETLTLTSTIHGTKGKILIGTSAYDELNNRLGLGTVNPTEKLDVVGNGKITNNLSVSSLGKATEYVTTVNEITGLLKTELMTDEQWITNVDLITALLIETNWTLNGYIGTTVGAVEGQTYACCNYLYIFKDGTFKRYREFNTVTTTYVDTATININDNPAIFNKATALTCNLYDCANLRNYRVTIINIGLGVLTIDAFSTQTINGSLTRTLYQYESVTLFTNGSNWFII